MPQNDEQQPPDKTEEKCPEPSDVLRMPVEDFPDNEH